MTLLVTGGAGFIGANFVLDWLAASDEPIINLDKLTYAGNPETLASLQGDARHQLVQGDIGDSALLARLLAEHRPRAVVNFAAESHVDRSIHGPGEFIETNIVGTFRLLEAVRGHWTALPVGAVSDRDEPSANSPSRSDRSCTTGISSPACVHRRGVRLFEQRRPGFNRNPPLRAQQPLQRKQGGQRPLGARLAPHVWPAGTRHQKWINAASLQKLAQPLAKNGYGQYLLNLLK